MPHGTEFFLGENRGNSRAFAHAVIDAGADLVVGSGPHVLRGVEIYHGHLIAYSLGNFAGFRNFGIGRQPQPERHLPRRAAARTAAGASARLIPVALRGVGLPALDPSDASVRLVARLSREDFGANAARFAPNGVIEHANGRLVGSRSMSTPPTPPPRSPERQGSPPLRRSNDDDAKSKHHFPWKVEPSPDGRGAPPPPKPPMVPRLARRIWPFLIVLLALNYWVASTIPDDKARVEVPVHRLQEGRARRQRRRDHLEGHGDPGPDAEADHVPDGQGRDAPA